MPLPSRSDVSISVRRLCLLEAIMGLFSQLSQPPVRRICSPRRCLDAACQSSLQVPATRQQLGRAQRCELQLPEPGGPFGSNIVASSSRLANLLDGHVIVLSKFIPSSALMSDGNLDADGRKIDDRSEMCSRRKGMQRLGQHPKFDQVETSCPGPRSSDFLLSPRNVMQRRVKRIT